MGGGGGCFEDVYLTVLWCGCVWMTKDGVIT